MAKPKHTKKRTHFLGDRAEPSGLPSFLCLSKQDLLLLHFKQDFGFCQFDFAALSFLTPG